MTLSSTDLFTEVFAPGDLRSFLDRHWPRRPYHGAMTPRALARFLAEPTTELANMFRVHRGQTALFFPKGDGTWVRSMLPTPRAAELVPLGITMLHMQAQRFVPFFAECVEVLRAATGLPEGYIDCIVHHSAPDKGLGWHFDNQDVLTLQLSGAKVWRYTPVAGVPGATVNFMLGDHLRNPELSPYFPEHETLPSTWTPPDAVEVELVPGSVLFVPRGHWHASEAREESLSIPFRFHGMTWMDLLLREIRATLIGHEAWRQPVPGGFAGAGHPQTAVAEREFRALLERLPADLRPLVEGAGRMRP